MRSGWRKHAAGSRPNSTTSAVVVATAAAADRRPVLVQAADLGRWRQWSFAAQMVRSFARRLTMEDQDRSIGVVSRVQSLIRTAVQ
jgi:hypothetical protein